MSTITAVLEPQGAEPAEARVPVRAHLRHIGALTRRNLLRIKADPQSLADVVLMPIVLTVLFTYVFGGAIAGSQHHYIQYMIPGLLGLSGLNLAMAVGTGLNTDFGSGVMDRFRTMPIGRASVLVGKLAAESLRVLCSYVLMLGFALLLGMRVHTGVPQLLAAVALSMLFGSAMVWVSMLLGMALNSAQAVQGAAMLVIMPLQFCSSVFAPPSTMPGWLRAFTTVNPLSSLADASRALINGGPVLHPVLIVLAWSFGITAVFAPLAVAKFRART